MSDRWQLGLSRVRGRSRACPVSVRHVPAGDGLMRRLRHERDVCYIQTEGTVSRGADSGAILLLAGWIFENL